MSTHAGIDDRTEAVAEKLEGSATRRKLSGLPRVLVTVLAVGLSIFHLYTSYFGTLGAIPQRTIHLTVLLVLVFLLYPPRAGRSSSKISLLDIVLALASVVVGGYIFVQYDKMMLLMKPLNAVDIALGIAAVVLVLEATRRVIGVALPIVAIVFLFYAFAGNYMPDVIAHPGYGFERIAYQMYFSTEGVYGLPLGISATYVAAFILFGAFLEASGGGEAFIQFARSLFGNVRGGPAKIAVVASSLFGTISGSSVANVVGTGTFTIPMMKRIGYPPSFAGAVEAAASTGGQIMPPVMGAAAFLIVETLGVSYASVCLAALLPALLYYWAIFVMVDLRAAKCGLKGLPRESLPSVRQVAVRQWPFLIPIVVLLYYLAVWKGTPTKAAFLAILSLVIVCLSKRETRLSLKKVLFALEKGAMGMIDVATASAASGVLIGVITLTGLGVRLSSIMIELAHGNLAVLLVLTAVAALILGMGVPATAAYIIVSVLLAPALTNMGVPPLAAHLFVFYFAILSMVTPPVAVAAYAGASIARANPMRTGYSAFFLCLTGFIVPFLFAYHPGFLLQGSLPEIALAIFVGALATAALGLVVEGYFLQKLAVAERAALVAGVGFLLWYRPGAIVVGTAVILLVVLLHARKARAIAAAVC